MQENNQPQSIVEQAVACVEGVFMRYHLPHGGPAIVEAIQLLTQLRLITWRVSAHSNQAANNVWKHLEASGVRMEPVLQMTTEFAARFELESKVDSLTKVIAPSINFLHRSKAIAEEFRSLNGATQQIKDILSENWWLLFLYLLATSNAAVDLQQALGEKVLSLAASAEKLNGGKPK